VKSLKRRFMLKGSGAQSGKIVYALSREQICPSYGHSSVRACLFQNAYSAHPFYRLYWYSQRRCQVFITGRCSTVYKLRR